MNISHEPLKPPAGVVFRARDYRRFRDAASAFCPVYYDQHQVVQCLVFYNAVWLRAYLDRPVPQLLLTFRPFYDRC